jgi:hypothetical protein
MRGGAAPQALEREEGPGVGPVKAGWLNGEGKGLLFGASGANLPHPDLSF